MDRFFSGRHRLFSHFVDGQVRASYTAADGLGAGRVSDVQLDDDGTLWISTEGGLSRLKNNRLATLTSKNELPCEGVTRGSVYEAQIDRSLYSTCRPAISVAVMGSHKHKSNPFQ
jgi:ligand-binding sensor domain-containing protein